MRFEVYIVSFWVLTQCNNEPTFRRNLLPHLPLRNYINRYQGYNNADYAN
jgi:hypothetical protein